MDGLIGECPEWYADIQAAKYLECKPWELAEQCIFWKDAALMAMEAEARGQDIRRQRGK